MTTAELSTRFARLKGVQMTTPRSIVILKEALDKRHGLKYVYTVDVDVSENLDVKHITKANHGINVCESKTIAPVPLGRVSGMDQRHIVIVGAGPAGLFAAHACADSGAKVTLLERGHDVKQRLGKVRNLFKQGELDGESNICFGEGGAGTFSDGKLTTRKNHPWIRYAMEFLVENGAPPEIVTSAKPHVGTDRLRAVVVKTRKRLIAMGVNVCFGAKVSNLSLDNGRVCKIHVDGADDIEDFDDIVWASGHSARDSFKMLHKLGLPLEPKAFAVGVRIEHPQALVNRWLHGDEKKRELGAADYRVACNISADRSVYSFCMCPGGQVVCSSSHDGYHVVNGMSNYARNSAFANSGLVAKVGIKDFDGKDGLAGVRFQEDIEAKAHAAAKSYLGPAQRVPDFLAGKLSDSLPPSSYSPGLVPIDLNQVLPPFICENLKRALHEFEAKYPGFAGEEALLIGTETRTSSPVHIPRDVDGSVHSLKNFFPCGEGLGYAGGIVSAALDGLFIAQCLRKRYGSKN